MIDRFQESLRRKRLLQSGCGAKLHCHLQEIDIAHSATAGHGGDSDGGMLLAHRHKNFDSLHVRHDDVCYDEIERGFFELVEASPSIFNKICRPSR